MKQSTTNHPLKRAYLCRGGGSEAEYGDVGEEALHDAEELVVRPEVVAPLAAAVHLVDRQPGEDAGLVARLVVIRSI